MARLTQGEGQYFLIFTSCEEGQKQLCQHTVCPCCAWRKVRMLHSLIWKSALAFFFYKHHVDVLRESCTFCLEFK